jgi:hypothetical protein
MIQKNLSVLAALLAATAATAEAQSTGLASGAAASRISAPLAAVGDAPLLSEAARASFAQQAAGSARPGTLVFSAMGGLIGAGAGYLVSTVIHSDWDKETNSTFASHRRSFALSGAAVGAGAALVLDRLSSAGPGLVVRSGPGGGRSGAGGPILLPELQEIASRSAYEAVAALRPQWLLMRGETIGSTGTLVGASGMGAGAVSAIPGDVRIGAFVDGVPLEDVNGLRDVPINIVERIEFRTGAVAGGPGTPGHVQRAIIVITADGRSE